MPRIKSRRPVKILLFALLLVQGLRAQDRPIDPTWLHRFVPNLTETKTDLTSPSCHYQPMFGEGDKDNRSLQTVARFGEVTLDAHGNCQTVTYDRQEELYKLNQARRQQQGTDEAFLIREFLNPRD